MADSRIPAPVDQFRAALRAGDVERVRALLASDPEVRAAVNAPIGHFGGRRRRTRSARTAATSIAGSSVTT